MTTAPLPATTTISPTTFLAYNPVFNGAATTTTSSKYNKRSYETSAADMKDYPKLIKMVEKRKPMDNTTDYVQPYCQQMQVLDDWSIEPIWTVPQICIDEVLYPSTIGVDTKRVMGRDSRDVVADLESYCICEWTSY